MTMAGVGAESRSRNEVTVLLRAWSAGDAGSRDRIFAVLYAELRRRAHSLLRGERPDHTLDATALVHEAYERLVDQRRVTWQDRAHFLAVAATTMRRVLVDHARRKAADKRGAGWRRETLDLATPLSAIPNPDVLLVDQAIEGLAVIDATQARIIELRFFGGLSIEEAAAALDISAATVKREWRVARAWLWRKVRELEPA